MDLATAQGSFTSWRKHRHDVFSTGEGERCWILKDKSRKEENNPFTTTLLSLDVVLPPWAVRLGGQRKKWVHSFAFLCARQKRGSFRQSAGLKERKNPSRTRYTPVRTHNTRGSGGEIYSVILVSSGETRFLSLFLPLSLVAIFMTLKLLELRSATLHVSFECV